MKKLFISIALLYAINSIAQENAWFVAAKTGLNISGKNPMSMLKCWIKFLMLQKLYYRKTLKN